MYKLTGILSSLDAATMAAAQGMVLGSVGGLGLYAFKQGVGAWKGAQWTYFSKEPQLITQVLSTSSADVFKLCMLFTLIDGIAKLLGSKFIDEELTEGDRNKGVRPLTESFSPTLLRVSASLLVTHLAAKKFNLSSSLALTVAYTALAHLLYREIDKKIHTGNQIHRFVLEFNTRLDCLKYFSLGIKKSSKDELLVSEK